MSDPMDEGIRFYVEALSLYASSGLREFMQTYPGLETYPPFLQNLRYLGWPSEKLWKHPPQGLWLVRAARALSTDLAKLLVVPPGLEESTERFLRAYSHVLEIPYDLGREAFSREHPELWDRENLVALDAMVAALEAAGSPHVQRLVDFREWLGQRSPDAQSASEAAPSPTGPALVLLRHATLERPLPDRDLLDTSLSLLRETEPLTEHVPILRLALTLAAEGGSSPSSWDVSHLESLEQLFMTGSGLSLSSLEELKQKLLSFAVAGRALVVGKLAREATTHADPEGMGIALSISRGTVAQTREGCPEELLLMALSSHCAICVDAFQVTHADRDLEEAVNAGGEYQRRGRASGLIEPHGLHNFGRALTRMHQQTGVFELLERAEVAHRESVERSSLDDPARGKRLQALANAQLSLAGLQRNRSNKEAILKEAVGHLEEAIECLPPEDELAVACRSLGTALLEMVRSEFAGVDSGVDAVRLLDGAERLVRHDASRRGMYNLSVAEAHDLLHSLTHDEEHARLAETAYVIAAESALPNSPIHAQARAGLGLLRRRSASVSLETRRAARPLLREAILAMLDGRYFESAAIWGSRWASIAEKDDAWEELVEAREFELAALSATFEPRKVRESEARLKRISSAATSRFAALVRLDRPAAAALAAEEIRSVQLSRSQGVDQESLDRLRREHPDLFEAYLAAGDAGGARPLSLDTESWSNDLLRSTTLRSSLLKVHREIQQKPGFEAFGKRVTFEDIAQEAVRGPVIYVVDADPELLAVVVTPEGGAKTVLLKGARLAELKELLLVYFNAEVARRDYPTEYLSCMSVLASWLGEFVMFPIVEQLEGFDHACLIPTGYLSVCPLQAAWRQFQAGREYVISRLALRYLPSVKVAMMSRAPQLIAPDAGILIVENPQPVSGAFLSHARLEASVIEEVHMGARRLRLTSATLENVLAALPEGGVAHFACHGSLDFSDHQRSGLLMAGDRLLTPSLIAAREGSPPAMVVLSACDSGFSNLHSLDDGVTLTSAFLVSGARAAIGSLWPVSDLGTAALMWIFYELLSQAMPAAAALRGAQLALASASLPSTRARSASALRRNIEAGNFRHPYYWAGFMFLGGDVVPGLPALP